MKHVKLKMDDFGSSIKEAIGRYALLAEAPEVDPETRAYFLGMCEGLEKAWIIFSGGNEEE